MTHPSRRYYQSLMLALACGSAPIAAHITLNEPVAEAGSYYVGFLRVSHGCGGSPTITVRVEIPPSITGAKPQPKPGWTIKIEKMALATPIKGEGGDVRDRVSAITWTGRLEADEFDQFGLLLKLPAQPGLLYFPTVQRCETGENDWTMIPAAGQPWHSVKSPAPVLDVRAGMAVPMAGMKM